MKTALRYATVAGCLWTAATCAVVFVAAEIALAVEALGK